MADWSSATTSVPISEKFLFLRSSATAGPERSARSPLAQESLTVMTAAVMSFGVEPGFARSGVKLSGVEEDIFFLLFGFCAAVALRFVQLAEAFHQQALSVQLGGLLGGLAFEIDLEVSVGPAQNLEYGRIPNQRAVRGVRDLSFFEVQFAFVVLVGEGKGTALAAHLERLDQVDDVHLQQAAAQDSVRGYSLGHLFQSDLVDDPLDALRGFPQEEWFLDKIVHGKIRRAQLLADVGLGRHQDDCGFGGSRTAS